MNARVQQYTEDGRSQQAKGVCTWLLLSLTEEHLRRGRLALLVVTYCLVSSHTVHFEHESEVFTPETDTPEKLEAINTPKTAEMCTKSPPQKEQQTGDGGGRRPAEKGAGHPPAQTLRGLLGLLRSGATRGQKTRQEDLHVRAITHVQNVWGLHTFVDGRHM